MSENIQQQSRSRGRSARKRHRRQATADLENVNAEQFRLWLQQLEPEEAAVVAGITLTQTQQDVLNHYIAQLRVASSALSRKSGAWQFLVERLEEARRLGLEQQLRQLVWQAAAKFANS